MELLLFNIQTKKKGRADWDTRDGSFCAGRRAQGAGRRVWCLTLSSKGGTLANHAREHQTAACMYVHVHREGLGGSKEQDNHI